MIEFFVAFKVRPKNDRKAAIVGGFARVVNSKETKVNADSLASLFYAHRPKAPLQGFLRLDLIFTFPYPKATSKKKTAGGPDFYIGRSDRDNLHKQVGDVLKGCGFYGDDRQLVAGGTVKAAWLGPHGVFVRLQETDSVDRDELQETLATVRTAHGV